jgi:hypothetical protein
MSISNFNISITEVIGYIGTLLVLISFLMKDMKKLRIGNIIGSSTFILYGILLHYSVPIILTNVSIVLINAFYLVKESKRVE